MQFDESGSMQFLELQHQIRGSIVGSSRALGGTAMVVYAAEKALVVGGIENAHGYISLAFFSCMARARDEAKGSPGCVSLAVSIYDKASEYFACLATRKQIYESYDDVDQATSANNVKKVKSSLEIPLPKRKAKILTPTFQKSGNDGKEGNVHVAVTVPYTEQAASQTIVASRQKWKQKTTKSDGSASNS